MTVKLFGCVCGQFHGPGSSLGMTAEVVSVPVPFYVIDHPDGVALFDCGQPAAMMDEDDTYLGRLRQHGTDVTLTAEEMVAPSLERLDIDPARVRYVALSHLHFDHAGGLHQLPNTTLVVQRREWEAGFDREMATRYALPKRYFDLGHAVKLVDGEHDLFGDGSAVLVPSFGHTPGHQSMRVRSEMGDHILVGDACYNCATVETRAFPPNADHAAMGASLDRLLGLREADTVMVYGHDPEQWGERPVLPNTRA